LLLITAVMLAGFSYTAKESEAASSVKICYVDAALVFDSYGKKKDLDKELAAEGKAKTDERDAIVEKIKSMRNELELLSDKRREKKQEQIDEKIRGLQAFDQETKSQLLRKRDGMVRDILKEIDSAVTDYAKKNGYSIILNSRVLIYADKQYDVTKEVIEILNSKYKGKN